MAGETMSEVIILSVCLSDTELCDDLTLCQVVEAIMQYAHAATNTVPSKYFLEF